jgi:hypothetical protein
MALELNGTTGVQGNSGAFVAGTAVASTSGTSIDFTSIPSWVKRVTVMFNGVSTNGSSPILMQIGSGSVSTSGYTTAAQYAVAASVQYASSTAGFILEPTGNADASAVRFGCVVLSNLGSNTWVSQGSIYPSVTAVTVCSSTGGSPALSGALDRVRITTVGGTNTFDAGSINILYE